MQKCKFCEAELIYIKMRNGRVTPCEARKIEVWRLPKGKKNAVTEHGELFKCEYEPVPFIGSEYAFIPHWANCPGANQARRRA